MADGNFYVDSRGPWIITDSAALTLSTANQLLLPLGNLPVLGSNYWWAGKEVFIRAFGRITSSATPGTVTFSLLWGNGTSANGTVLVSSAAITLVAVAISMLALFASEMMARYANRRLDFE